MEDTDWHPITERTFESEDDFWIHPRDLDAFEMHFLMQVELPHNGRSLRKIRFYKDVNGRFYMARRPLKNPYGLHHLMPINAKDNKQAMAVIGGIMMLALGREMHHEKCAQISVDLAKELYPLIPDVTWKELLRLTDIPSMEALDPPKGH